MTTADALVCHLLHVFPRHEVAVLDAAWALLRIASQAPTVRIPTRQWHALRPESPPPDQPTMRLLVHTLCCTVFAPPEWQCLMDHVLVHGPRFLTLAAAAATQQDPPNVHKTLAMAYTLQRHPQTTL